jgi:hypothetical protein
MRITSEFIYNHSIIDTVAWQQAISDLVIKLVEFLTHTLQPTKVHMGPIKNSFGPTFPQYIKSPLINWIHRYVADISSGFAGLRLADFTFSNMSNVSVQFPMLNFLSMGGSPCRKEATKAKPYTLVFARI